MKKYFDLNRTTLITGILGAFLIAIILIGIWRYGKYFCEGGNPMKNIPLPGNIKIGTYASACAQGDYFNIAINILTNR